MRLYTIVLLGFFLPISLIEAKKIVHENVSKEIIELPMDDQPRVEKTAKKREEKNDLTTAVGEKKKNRPVKKEVEKKEKESRVQETKLEKNSTKKRETSKKVTKKEIEQKSSDSCAVNVEVVPFNKIVVRIYSKGEGKKDSIITEHMVDRPSLEGRARTLDELIIEFCVFDKAVNDYHMPPATKEAEQHIENLKNQNKLTQSKLEEVFRDSGWTYDEVVDELVRFYTNRSFISSLITSKVLVTQKDIEEYHKKNPEVVPTSYKIEKAFIAKEDVSKEAIENLRKYGVGQDNVIWEPAYWIAEEDLADSKKFITKMHEGVVKVIDGGDKWEVIRLNKKINTYTKPLEERYGEIINKLQYAQFEEKLEKFKKELLQEYTIVRL